MFDIHRKDGNIRWEHPTTNQTVILPRPEKKQIYLIGSLRNPEIPTLGNILRKELDCNVFDDWYAAGPEADDKWKEYEQSRGRNYLEALEGKAAENVFAFDKTNLCASSVCVLVLPAGKSAHMEAGWMAGRHIPVFVLIDNPDRWDVMYKFFGPGHVVDKTETLIERVRRYVQ